MDVFTIVSLQVALVAAGFYVLFLVVRAAILSALRADRAERAKSDASHPQ
jgi:hypothetical protein